MITKLLLTIGVIIAVVLIVRTRRPANARQTIPKRGATSKAPWSPARVTAWTLIAVIITVTFALTAYQWFGAREVVTVRVINSNTGDAVSYQVYKDEAKGRRFNTMDGRIITLAEVERMEIYSALQ